MPTTYPTATTRAGQNRQVYEGRAKKTKSGLTKKDLKKSKTGKIVSRKKSMKAKKHAAPLSAWRKALKKACKEKGVPYTIPKKGTALYKLAKKSMKPVKKPKKSRCNLKSRKVCKKSKTCSWVARYKTKKGSRKGHCRRSPK